MLPIIDVEATAQRIDSRRIENHLTVRDLQNVFGFSTPQAIYKWQRGFNMMCNTGTFGAASQQLSGMDQIKKILKRYRIPNGYIELEITETVFQDERETMITTMNLLKQQDVQLSMDDFGVVFSACVEKNIPIAEIKSLFYSDKDVMDIYASVDAYISQPVPEEAPDEIITEEREETALSESTAPSEVIVGDAEFSQYERTNEASDVDMFNNLVTLMATTDVDEARFINTAQGKFMDTLQQLQDVSSSISVFSTEFINSMKSDKEEIKKLNAMIMLMKKLLSQKQGEINELRGEISKLNSRIHSFESAEFKQDALREKVGELYKLAANTGEDRDRLLSL